MSQETPRRSLHALPSGTVLHDYIIESELGNGGFSIVYLARHRLNTGWQFAIKEFLPAELAARVRDGATVRPVNAESTEVFDDGLRRFRVEAEQLRRFRNEPHIVSCLNYFEGNGTAYLVMDYDDGLPLSEFLRQREEAGSPFTEADLRAVVEPLLEGLEVVHRAGVLHRDIKPGNIFVRRPDEFTGRPAQPVLIDFGAAKQNYLARHSRSRAPYTEGYAAYEQVSSEGDIGPWTDIYAVGALMWRMVAGGCPGDGRLLVPDGGGGTHEDGVWSPTPRAVESRAYALHRGQADPLVPAVELGAGRFSPTLLRAIDSCLTLYPRDRVRNCAMLSESLNGTRPTVTPEHSRQEPDCYSAEDGAGPPPCPRCGDSMVPRTARRGPNPGSQFWGCSRFPECRGTRNRDDAPSPAPTRRTPRRTPDDAPRPAPTRNPDRHRSPDTPDPKPSGPRAPPVPVPWYHPSLWLVPAGLLVLALLSLPIWYYDFLRVAVCAAAIGLIYVQVSNDNAFSAWVVALGALAILHNPILPVYIGDRGIWRVLNLLSVGVFLAHCYAFRRMVSTRNSRESGE